ncbi:MULTISPECIES: alpha/beta hydrolase [unclassified Rhodococcus (in: high G+C Gram-positive bacteria)]|uniref:alpha/beta hydrolase n=1 Tax=unclassified Rhodococcus (in: high G+C Gram-positive bacteria) TaxID=192944 RepID=UPI0024B7CADA|nr:MULTISPECIES: alpha/beta hydrolase [unclassified Rhodococcus (in: high G+C Gram-positive bacteria)]MDI9927158.1 alpha/beta hydrolase [Rhodococcus sp. IEGM 1341]MDV8056314.1 alpha/beta hydrolase [Rhodococcus sp. IEGM 1343]
MTNLLPTSRGGIEFSRRLVATSMNLFGPVPKGTRVDIVADVPVRGEWVRAPGLAPDPRVILYIHGSAYVICSARTHRGLTARLSSATGLPVFTVDYRLAPEHPFPAAADDLEAAYRWLLGQGYNAANIVIAGDSAGGHLAADLLIENDRTGTPQPGAMVLFSPLIDLDFELSARMERTRKDPMISAKAARGLVALYTEGHDTNLPRLRLDLALVRDLPPTLIQVGGAEMLRGDARHLHSMIDAAGGRSELEIWPDQMHVFQALPRLIPEAGHALEHAAEFIAHALDNPVVQHDSKEKVSR